MPIATLCLRSSTVLLVSNAFEAAGFTDQQPQTNPSRTRPDLFLENLQTEQPRYVLITSEFLTNPPLFEEAKQAAPKSQLILCLLPDAVATVRTLWPVLDTLKFDVLCSLDELTNCLMTLKTGHHYTTSLLATSAVFQKKETLPGFDKLTPAQKRVLALLMQGMKCPAISDKIFLSRRTVYNHEAAIAHELGVPGGQGQLNGFIMQNLHILKQLMNE